MARYNPDLMQLDDGDTGTPRVAGPRNDVSQIPYDQAIEAARKAAIELGVDPAILEQERKDAQLAAIKAEREARQTSAAEERASSDPMKDYNNRPDAQTAATKDYIVYYAWVGGRTTGEWKPYRVARTEDNMAAYGARAIGGPTKASLTGKVTDANGLTVQPTPIKDQYGQITGWEINGQNAIDRASTDGASSSGKPGNTGSSGGFSGTFSSGSSGSGSGSRSLTGTGGTTSSPLDMVAADEARAKRTSAYNTLYDEFNKYGLGTLVSDIKNYLIDNTFDPSEFSIQLQNTDAYKKRFAANAERIKAGLGALRPAEYIALEDQYQNLMRNYGLPESYYAKGDLGIQEGFNKLIANDVSATELEDRLTTAQQRVVNADPNVLKSLKAFYPDITNGDILAYTLDPKNAIDMIKRKVTAAEIGAAQYGAGLNTGVASAEALAKAGVSGAQYAQAAPFISQAAERGSQLADIYAQTPYDQASAEAEALNLAGGAQAAKQRKKLSALEQAQFAGSSGVGALGRDKALYGSTYGKSGAF